MQKYEYIFNVGGDFTAKMKGMAEATGKFSASVAKAQTIANKATVFMRDMYYSVQTVQSLSEGLTAVTTSGITLDSQMHDLSAIAGIVGDDLKAIEGYARESAKTFGTDAAVAVEGYKLLLSGAIARNRQMPRSS